MLREKVVRHGATLDIPQLARNISSNKGIAIGIKRIRGRTGRYRTATRLPSTSYICGIESAVACLQSSPPRRGRTKYRSPWAEAARLPSWHRSAMNYAPSENVQTPETPKASLISAQSIAPPWVRQPKATRSAEGASQCRPPRLVPFGWLRRIVISTPQSRLKNRPQREAHFRPDEM
jgi:hypothetical protein